MRKTSTLFIFAVSLIMLSGCAGSAFVGDDPSSGAVGKDEGKADILSHLPVVVASPQFLFETDIKSPDETESSRDLANLVLQSLDTFYRTLYGPGFGLSNDKVRRGLLLGAKKDSTPAESRQIESVRPHPVMLMRVALFAREEDYRDYVKRANLLEYYEDAALDAERLQLATYLHDTEEKTLDALFRIICHGFVLQLAPDFPAWLEFGLAAYLTQLELRRGIYLIHGKDEKRIGDLQKLLSQSEDLRLKDLLSERTEKNSYPEEKKLIAYGFVYWMNAGKSRRQALYSYIHEIRYNEVKRKALEMWKELPEEQRKKIKKPQPEQETQIQSRFFRKLHNDPDLAGKYMKKYILSLKANQPPAGEEEEQPK